MFRIALFESFVKGKVAMRQWTFITRHAAILVLMAIHPRITARDLSARVGVTERTVRTIISDLEQEGYITKKHEGRMVNYTVNPDRSLRYATQTDKAVGQLLSVLGGLPSLPPNGSAPLSVTKSS
jgi:DNA-binding transcriptional ArsR family regulator